jgi:DNA-binding MarR family transcriptional regulator
MAMAFGQLVDGLHERLAKRGWDDVRPSYGFVLLALRHGPSTATELGKLLGVTKQAASHTLDAMVDSGYLSRTVHPADTRQRIIRLAPRGRRLLRVVEQIYAELEAEWSAVVGGRAVEQMRRNLTSLVLHANEGVFPVIRPTP